MLHTYVYVRATDAFGRLDASLAEKAQRIHVHHIVARHHGGALPPTVVLAFLAGLAIFAVDTFTPLDTAIAALYGAVVMLSADGLERRGVILAGGLCIGLTVLSFFVTHGATLEPSAMMRCAVSISVIALVTLLASRNVVAREKLRRQAELLDLTHDAILVRDLSDVILSWNRGAERLYGWDRSDAVGAATDVLLKTDFRTAREPIVARLLVDGRWEGEVRRLRSDGNEIVVSARWVLQNDGNGTPAAVIETSNDVTARQAAQDALRATQAELATATRSVVVGQFTASLAHEINQPLAAVVTNGAACLRWLDRPEPDVGEARQTVQRIIENGRRASDVVARLRALSRGERRTHGPLDLGAVIVEGLALTEWELAQTAVVVETQLDPALPEISGDREELQQVVINLVTNAAQAMQDSPQPRLLTVTARGEAALGGRAASVEVCDRGSGIEPVRLDRIFQAFSSEQPGRLGLGLSICRTIIEAHGGRIEASINPGGGMTFRFLLPATPSNPPEEVQS